MRVLAILVAGYVAGPVWACSPMEVGPCDVTPMPEDGLLAPYKDACLGVFAIEEFAVTAAPNGGWLLDPVAMSCDAQPVCSACDVVWATPILGCEGPDCWDRQAPLDMPPAE